MYLIVINNKLHQYKPYSDSNINETVMYDFNRLICVFLLICLFELGRNVQIIKIS